MLLLIPMLYLKKQKNSMQLNFQIGLLISRFNSHFQKFIQNEQKLFKNSQVFQQQYFQINLQYFLLSLQLLLLEFMKECQVLMMNFKFSVQTNYQINSFKFFLCFHYQGFFQKVMKLLKNSNLFDRLNFQIILYFSLHYYFQEPIQKVKMLPKSSKASKLINFQIKLIYFHLFYQFL